ncbi:hypothetical protein LARV_02056 [Longilinea arvoryzae]|uniref:Uncharacterized protein n=1 Tax=Longilinea arvoryzae TaxID=360412 RepID=A0A0S7BJC7_9CHLR|nr:hypothetical protein [Longilinea arvoryzae]GAP14290.1 hypothetical protein LARV_02056 [Longilinea arvoryzae]
MKRFTGALACLLFFLTATFGTLVSPVQAAISTTPDPTGSPTQAADTSNASGAEGGCFTTNAWHETENYLIYHMIRVDEQNMILPWYDPSNLCNSYDHMLHLVFEWWLNMERNPAEPDLPYYLMHQIWQSTSEPDYDPKGLGGDQLAMAISSWTLYYAYTGDTRALDDMVLIANHVLDNGMSPATDLWPNLPYPYNVTRLDKMDGDMIFHENFTMLDKAGSFGYELVNLYKITGNTRYLQAAVKIANTLANHTQAGDEVTSPLPYRVNTKTGELPVGGNPYTTYWTGLLMLWEGLEGLGQGNIADYQTAHTKVLNWLRTYPVHNNQWGPFFEDGPGWSITQTNAVTLAMYIMDHRDLWGPTWQADARSALDWPYAALDNLGWIDYGVELIDEQTGYRKPGNSHNSRQASMELRYAELTGDTSRVTNSVRQLSWATYSVDFDGKNRYPYDNIWLTDGYGDYVRHYLRAMAAAPWLAPDDQDHLLRTSSIIKFIRYQPDRIEYRTFDGSAQEKLKITSFMPLSVTANGVPLQRLNSISDLETQTGFTLGAPGDLPTVMRIHHENATSIVISGVPPKYLFLPLIQQIPQ